MSKSSKIQQIFLDSYAEFLASDFHISGIQEKAARAILTVNPATLAATSASVQTVDTWNFTTTPAATVTARTARRS